MGFGICATCNGYWCSVGGFVNYCTCKPVEPAPKPAPSGDGAWVNTGNASIDAAYAAGKADGARTLDMDDETLVAEIAFEVGQATRQQPEMGGRCRRLHDDAENRRIARAAIRAINRIARRGSEGK